MVGHGYVRADVCAACQGPLRHDDGHYHERTAEYPVGAEPVCCACKGCPAAGRHAAKTSGDSTRRAWRRLQRQAGVGAQRLTTARRA